MGTHRAQNQKRNEMGRKVLVKAMPHAIYIFGKVRHMSIVILQQPTYLLHIFFLFFAKTIIYQSKFEKLS